MKPASFEYKAPSSLDELTALLAAHGDEARILAGGQSLVPMLNFRLVRPSCVIDINRIDGLAYIRRQGGNISFGALARTRDLEKSSLIASGWPLLREAAEHVGYPAIRNRGTVCGSVAHADPNAELPAALAALDARLHVQSSRGERVVVAKDFFVGPLRTVLEADEILDHIEVPALPPKCGTAFVEFARKKGDFALAGAAAVITLMPDERCARAAVAVLGTNFSSVRVPSLERGLRGTTLREADVSELADTCCADIDVPQPRTYRRALLRQLITRAVVRAAARAVHP